jgi:hypothetical protein
VGDPGPALRAKAGHDARSVRPAVVLGCPPPVMRPAYLLPLAAVLLAPVPARADPPPRVSVRLDYQRDVGAAACPAEAILRDEVARLMGYDPFDGVGDDWLHVVLQRTDKGFAATIDRNPPKGKLPWHEVFPSKGFGCPGLIVAVAPEIAGILEPAPSLDSAATPPEPVPELRAAPIAAELPAAQARPPELPAVQPPPSAPSSSSAVHRAGVGVAVVSYAASIVFLGLGIAYTVDTQNRANDANTALGQAQHTYGLSGCTQGGAASTTECKTLASDTQAWNTAYDYRNTWYALSGATAAVGMLGTVLAMNLRSTTHVTAQVNVAPGRLTIRGSF